MSCSQRPCESVSSANLRTGGEIAKRAPQRENHGEITPATRNGRVQKAGWYIFKNSNHTPQPQQYHPPALDGKRGTP